MRVFLLLLLALAVAAVLALYPNIAQQNMHFEAFGWIVELNQAVFLLILLLILTLFWAMRKIILIVLTLPLRLWRAIWSRSRRLKEEHLRHGIARLVDMHKDLGANDFKKADSVIPAWLVDLLEVFTIPVQDQKVPRPEQDSLKTALVARLVTRPKSALSSSLRKEFLKAWLQVSPEAPLARKRMCALAEEEQDWATAIGFLENQWKNNKAKETRTRLVRAYLGLAEQGPDDRIDWLRKAQKLDPDSGSAILALGLAYNEIGDQVAVRRLWNKYLKDHDNDAVARSLLDITEDCLRAYRKTENNHAHSMPASYQWLRAQLAYRAGLTGLATEHIQALAKQYPGKLAWQTWGDWHSKAGDWEQAAQCYTQALKSKS